MKKAFSLVEVVISIVILSFVMITLFQIKNNNIFLLNKSDENVKLADYILLIIDINDNLENKNENISLSEAINFDNDEIRKELKEIKIKMKDDKLKDFNVEHENIKFEVKTYARTYEIENKIKKSIYSFKVKF